MAAQKLSLTGSSLFTLYNLCLFFIHSSILYPYLNAEQGHTGYQAITQQHQQLHRKDVQIPHRNTQTPKGFKGNFMTLPTTIIAICIHCACSYTTQPKLICCPSRKNLFMCRTEYRGCLNVDILSSLSWSPCLKLCHHYFSTYSIGAE